MDGQAEVEQFSSLVTPLQLPRFSSNCMQNTSEMDSYSQIQIRMPMTLESAHREVEVPEGCHIMSAMELNQLLASSQDQTMERKKEEENGGDYLILDTRPFSEYSRGAIVDTLHVSLPSTLMRRKNFTFEKLLMHMSPEDQSTVKMKFQSACDSDGLSIVLYAGSNLQPNRTSLSKECLGLATKLLDYEGVYKSHGRVKVFVLACGFHRFSQEFPQFTWCPAEATIRATGNDKDDYNNGNSGEQINDMGSNYNIVGPNTPRTTGVPRLRNLQLPEISTTGLNAKSRFHNFQPTINVTNTFTSTATSPFFRFAQNEESMDIETYLSAIKSRDSCSACTDGRLNVQIKYEKLLENYSRDDIDRCIPKWFQVLMSRDRLTFVEEFRKLDLIQQRRLNNSVSMAGSFQSTELGITTKVGVPLRRAISNRDGMKSGNGFNNYNHSFGGNLLQARTPMPVRSASGPYFPRMVHPSNAVLELNHPAPLLKHSNLDASVSGSDSDSDHDHDHEHDTAVRESPTNLGQTASQNLQLPSQQQQLPSRSPSPANYKWLRDIDSDLEGYPESDESSITIPYGFELGMKNRYKDIFPYEHTRVHLHRHTNSMSSLSPTQSLTKVRSGSNSRSCSNNIFNSESEAEDEEDGVECGENNGNKINNDVVMAGNTYIDNYINANYLMLPDVEILETNTKVRYIATQAPMLSTVHDFYTCIINDCVPLIIALTDEFEHGVERCFRYWKEAKFDDIEVKVLGEENLETASNIAGGHSKVILRKIRILYSGGTLSHDVIQVHIKDWPDLGVLTDPIGIVESICLKQTLLDGLTHWQGSTPDTVPTILVHCSAGCGRTGTWCTIDSILSNLAVFDMMQEAFVRSNPGKDYDPVVWVINTFREQRISMVQNINQFLFIYECLLHYFSMMLKDGQSDEAPLQKVRDGMRDLGMIQDFINTR